MGWVCGWCKQLSCKAPTQFCPLYVLSATLTLWPPEFMFPTKQPQTVMSRMRESIARHPVTLLSRFLPQTKHTGASKPSWWWLINWYMINYLDIQCFEVRWEEMEGDQKGSLPKVILWRKATKPPPRGDVVREQRTHAEAPGTKSGAAVRTCVKKG